MENFIKVLKIVATLILIVVGTITGEKGMQRIIEKRQNGTKRVKMVPDPNSNVEQGHKGETDINDIVSKYQRTGLMPYVNVRAIYGDFTGYNDFHVIQNRIAQANSNFMKLPSEIRIKFDNDPGKLIEFLQDPLNEAKAIEMGLLVEKVPEQQQSGIEPVKGSPVPSVPTEEAT